MNNCIILYVLLGVVLSLTLYYVALRRVLYKDLLKMYTFRERRFFAERGFYQRKKSLFRNANVDISMDIK